ncbi:FAS1-like dehydratase domain-containing protein [Streptomyces bluensis]|uniref:MaoC family dehydratase N-terminal domain-containing protein n=1 Tax=Streptomyces bluensis TaxID=33897 RepID=A0ABW6UJA7_9ACTN
MATGALQTDYVAMPIGTEEEGRAMIGYTTDPVLADVPIDLGVSLALSAVLEDPNPVYWDAELSESIWGARVVAAAVLKAFFCGLPWCPGEKPMLGSVAANALSLPANTLINVGAEETYHRPLRVGDWLTFTEQIVSISEKKRTALGRGFFITTHIEWRDQDGELVAEGNNVLLRYTAE